MIQLQLPFTDITSYVRCNVAEYIGAPWMNLYDTLDDAYDLNVNHNVSVKNNELLLVLETTTENGMMHRVLTSTGKTGWLHVHATKSCIV